MGDVGTGRQQDIKTSRPVHRGTIQDWSGTVQLWDYIFMERLQADLTSCKVLLTEAPLTSTSNRQKTLEIMFERYGFAAAFTQTQAALSLYAQGKPSAPKCQKGSLFDS